MTHTEPETVETPRGAVLSEAHHLITGDRNNTYGPPTQDFTRTANLATAEGFQFQGKPLQAHHVAIFMILLKLSRLAWSPDKRDSWVDAAGYAACGHECRVEEGLVEIIPEQPVPFPQTGWEGYLAEDQMVAVKLSDLVTVLGEAEGFVGGKDNAAFTRLAEAAGVS